MNTLDNFRKSVAAGICIGLGATAYVMCDNKVVGAFMFCLGLLVICMMGMNLFTGKIPYVIETKNKPDCVIVWVGNFAGSLLVSAAVRIALPEAAEKCHTIIRNKLRLDFAQIMLLGILCGILVFLAVHCFKIRENNDIGKYLGIIFAIPAFILCGFEHSIADMFYFATGMQTVNEMVKGILFLLTVTLANAIGGILFRLLTKEYEKFKEKSKQ